MGPPLSEYIYDAEFPNRGLIGRIVRAERIWAEPYGRVSYEIDCIDDRVQPEAVQQVFADDAFVKVRGGPAHYNYSRAFCASSYPRTEGR